MDEKNLHHGVIEHVSSYKCEKISLEGKKGRLHSFEGRAIYSGKDINPGVDYETHSFALRVLILDDKSFVQTYIKCIHGRTGEVLKEDVSNSVSIETIKKIKNNVNLLVKKYKDDIDKEKEIKDYSKLVEEASKMVGFS